MKDAVNIWNRIFGTYYEAVSQYAGHGPSAPKEKRRSRCTSLLALAFFGVSFLLTGLFIVLVRPYNLIFNWKIVFGDGGEIFQLWQNPPANLYLRVFLWNVTNKEDYMSGKDDKLKVQEVGPYVYQELLIHDNVTFNDNGTLSAIPRHPLVWVPELSEGRKEDDILILPNIALLSIAHVVSDESYFTKLGLNLIIRQTKSEPLVQMTAKEFMFGYSSPLMTLGNKFMPSWIFFDKLGLIDRMYDFEGDFETVYTGEKHPGQSGILDTYRGSTKIPQWDNPCGNIQGASDGTKFPSNIKENDTLLFFRKSMCRSKYLTIVNKTVEAGFDAYVYNFAKDSDDNGKYNKTNSCFCKDPENCLPVGLLDVHGCYYGFPIALSKPHFLDSDPIASSRIVGHHPDPSKHEPTFIIEPRSGTPLKISASFQINMALKNIATIANTERFSNMILPLLWAEFKLYGLPDSLLNRLKLYLIIAPTLEDVLMYSSFVCSVVLLFYTMYKFRKSKLPTGTSFNSPWMQDDLHCIRRKLSSYIPENQATMSAKELEVYFNSLITPLNQNLGYHDFADIKEEDV